MLRFGAEVNVWEGGSALITAFKKAYIRIAEKARKICPDVALVFSPNDISNRGANLKDYYPSDKYVDWVGISSYLNIAKSAKNTVNNTDAYYGRGIYQSQMLRIKEVIETFGAKKPIMISECGFMYQSADGVQTEAHAKQKLKEFYAYVNMVYPQVKAVFYFNTDVGGNHYSLEKNANMKAVYDAAIAANKPMSSSLSEEKLSYIKVDNMKYASDNMTFTAYAYYPAIKKTTVTIKVDGATKLTSSAAPYSVNVNTGAWKVGNHVISVTATSGSTTRTFTKVLNKSESGVVTCASTLKDIDTSHWGYGAIEFCLRNNLFGGTSPTTFEPNANITREQICAIMVKYCKYKKITLKKLKAKINFKDASKISNYAKEAVTLCQTGGIVGGNSDGTFNPKGNATRVEVAQILYNFDKSYKVIK